MALNRIQAGKLLNAREMELFAASLTDQLRGHDAKSLAALVRRTRTQRDKYSDLLRRQRVSTRARTGTKEGKSGVANARTAQKEQVFYEALQRLEKQQARLEAAQARKAPATAAAAGGKAASKRTQAPARSSKAPAAAPRSSKAPAKGGANLAAVAKSKRLNAGGLQRTLAHVSSRGRRQQAGRDARR